MVEQQGREEEGLVIAQLEFVKQQLAELEVTLEEKRRMLGAFGVKVFNDDPEPRYKPWKMPLDGGKAQAKKLMTAYTNVHLTVLDKLSAGYPLSNRRQQLIREGLIAEKKASYEVDEWDVLMLPEEEHGSVWVGKIYEGIHERGIQRGRYIALQMREAGKKLSMNNAISEEVDARQDAFDSSYVQAINKRKDASALWKKYERGVQEGIRQLL